MTITLDVSPEVQAELSSRAAARGCALEVYVARLLEAAARVPVEAEPVHRDVSRKSLREVFEPVRCLADDVDFSRNKSAARPVDLS